MSGAAYPAADGLPESDGSARTLVPAADAGWNEAASPARAVDFALLARARGGDSAAFAALVERHHRVLASLVRQRGGPRAPVEDILQETFAKALAGMGGFRGRSSFLTWTATIALNLATDWSRKERRRARLAPRADVETDAVAGPASDDAAERREESDRARVALDALPQTLRLAVTLRIVEDLTYEEVAMRLDAPVPRVRTWVSRGLERLRRKLEVRHD